MNRKFPCISFYFITTLDGKIIPKHSSNFCSQILQELREKSDAILLSNRVAMIHEKMITSEQTNIHCSLKASVRKSLFPFSKILKSDFSDIDNTLYQLYSRNCWYILCQNSYRLFYLLLTKDIVSEIHLILVPKIFQYEYVNTMIGKSHHFLEHDYWFDIMEYRIENNEIYLHYVRNSQK